MATPGKAAKKEKKKPVPVKLSLNSPYDLKWKPLEKGHARFILKTVTDKLVSLDLRKQQVKVVRKWRRKRKSKKGNADSVDTTEPIQELHERGCSDSTDTTEPIQESRDRSCSDSMDTAEPTQESHRRGCSDSTDTTEPTQESHMRGCSDSVGSAEPTQERGWTDKRLRNELAIGINEVTKALEKNELGLVLVCDSVKPAHMTSHLISLSQTRSVPACQVPGLSASLASSLGLSSVLALGFKRRSHAFADTLEALAPKVPPLGVAWVPGASNPEGVQVSGETEQRLGDGEPGGRRKRKLDEVSPGVQKDPVTLLQPLKVKKVIPKPSKIRKIKKTKK